MALTKVQKEGIETLINNNANDRVITGSGTANTLNAESGVQINSQGRMMVNGTYGAGMFNVTGESALGLDAKRQFLGINSDNDDMNIRATYYSGGAAGGAYPDIKFTTSDSERLRITAGGNVGIGTSSPSAKLHVSALGASDEPTIKLASENSTIFLRTAGSSGSFPTGGGGNDGELTYVGGDFRLGAATSNKNLMFFTGGYSERMRINSSGNVGIGTTSPASPLHLHESSSGSIEGLKITNSGTGSGLTDGLSIGLQSDEDVFIHNYENTAIHFGTNDTTRVSILAGGGLTFNGDTATANALDDYEEGTWTPTFDTSQSSGSITVGGYAIQAGFYRKVGSLVYVEGALRTSPAGVTKNSNGTWDIGGLPFTSASGGTHQVSGELFGGAQADWSVAPDKFTVLTSNTRARAREGLDDGAGGYTNGHTTMFYTGAGTNNRVFFCGSYIAA